MSGEKILYHHDDPHGQGDVYFIWQNGNSSTLLATTGSDGTVAIFNRQGQLQERIILQGVCAGFAWDSEGDLLGIITSSSSQLIIWDANTLQKQIIDTGLRDPLSCIIWSKTSQIVAVGTNRGNLAIYNHQNTKRVPILGKHSKRIICGAWSTENILALGSDDKTLSLSAEDGDSLRIVNLRDIPSDMHFAEMKTDERIPGENTISMILGKRTLYLYHLPEPEAPTELGFQPKYGSLIHHRWFGDGYILLGFSNGHVVAISTHAREVGQELWQVKNHRDNLTGISVCKSLELVASCGDNVIKVHSTGNLQETISILNIPDQASVKNIDWSTDGQLLAASTILGAITVFVTNLHPLFAVSPPRVALLTSLAEVSLYYWSPDRIKSMPTVVSLEIEPSFLAIGQNHLACGMNNHIWFYDLGAGSSSGGGRGGRGGGGGGGGLNETPILLGDREYLAEIKEVKINTLYCAVLCGGQIMLHPIESQNPITKDQQPQLFPQNIHGMQESIITCLIMTNDFLSFATDLGNLIYFSLENWTTVIRYRHSMGIKKMFSDTDGTKIAFIDDHNEGYIYSPSNEDIVLIPNFPKTCLGMLWDYGQTNVFIAYDDKICITYVYVKHSVDGRHVLRVGETIISSEQQPIMLYDGDLSLTASGGGGGGGSGGAGVGSIGGNGGRLTMITLKTHANSPGLDPKQQLENCMKLRKFTDCWELCKLLNDPDEWNRLGRAAIADLNITYAIRVFRKCGNAAMVMSLEDIQHIEDINYISGACAILLDKTDKAKTYFAKSVNPLDALELCRDMLQWEQAMSLAETLAPKQIPFISREYAEQLEFSGNYSEALMHYEKGVDCELKDGTDGNDVQNDKDHLKQCQSGIARTSIRNGDYHRGIQIAQKLNNKELLADCGDALISIGHQIEAAHMFELAERWDQSATILVQLKQWSKLKLILPQVTSSRLYGNYALAKEQMGEYQEAINYYRKCGDLDSAVRIYLDYLSDPHSASEIVLESRSIDASKQLAKFYQQIGEYDQALQFLILCGCLSDAFVLAKRHNKLRIYGELLINTADDSTVQPSDYLAVAQYFETERHTLLAGKYYYLAKEYGKSLKFLLKASAFNSDEQQAISLAIDCVATANDERLAGQLIEFLLGELDGTPKEPKYLFRLYMARKHYRDAAKTAVIIGSQEQIAGNYRSAHDLLFTMYQELKRNNLSISLDMQKNLTLLHRYTLVRVHVKIGDHLMAARLLVEVAANISQFPSHIVPILTSTVIECHRAGLKKSAFSYAAMLMRPEYRQQIDSKYSKKIETIVRKAPRGIKDINNDDDEDNLLLNDEKQLPCPICDANLSAMELTCYQCKTTLPICIATGRHISKENLAACPECDFPCFKQPMIKILDSTNQCPMCAEIVDSNKLNDVTNVASYLSVSSSS